METERLCIKCISECDIDDIVTLFGNEKNRQYLGGKIESENAQLKVNNLINDKDNYHFAIRLKKDNAFIGLVSITLYYDSGYKELSYEFLPQFWGNGYASESLKFMLHFCKEE